MAYAPALDLTTLFEVISIFELPKLENCMSKLCPRPLGATPPPPPRHWRIILGPKMMILQGVRR